MLKRRGQKELSPNLTAGPGKLTQALGIFVKHTGVALTQANGVWLESGPGRNSDQRIVTSTRIGVDYAQEDAGLPWRFYLGGSKWGRKF